ncbi:MAG: Hsp20/alpha crystallin family protein [Phycisphaerae bacterium]|nr:Hsp20/alpha crystallin family protein [Phycisphaerae bacterium]
MFDRCNGLMFAPSALAREVDEMFENLTGGATRPLVREAARAFPPLNIWSDEKAVYVEAALPGFRMEDVEVTLTRQDLTIKGKRETTIPEQAQWVHRERAGGEFARTVTIGEPLDHDKVTATMNNGLLLVTLPKSAVAQPRRITVNPVNN